MVVLHEPDPALLGEQYAATRDQVDGIVYVDNAGGRSALEAADIVIDASVTPIGDGTNAGLAAGINRGLAQARTHGAGLALLLDQDSRPAPGLVATLRGLLTDGAGTDRPVGAIGPAIVDELRGHTEHFARLRLPLNRRIDPRDDGPDAFEVDFLITSGTLVPLAVIDAVGGMDEGLFIDSVDFDWSFRTRAAGFALLATFRTTLNHRRGDDIHRVGPLALRLHSSFRLYYMYRNRFLLYRRAYVPLAWKVHDFARMAIKALLLVVFVPGRLPRTRAITRGIWAGLR